MKRENQFKQAKYLKMTQKSGCVSADYFMNAYPKETVFVLLDDAKQSGFFQRY